MILVTGYIKNTSGQPIPSASIQVVDGNFDLTGEGTAANGQGFFSLYINELLYPYGLNVSSVGYKPTVVKLSTFTNNGTIILAENVVDLPPVVVTSGSKNNYLLLIALAGGAFIILNDDKKKKVSGTEKINPNTALLIGGGLLGISVIQKILVSLGIIQGKGGTNVNNEQQNPYSPWKPAYYHALAPGTQYKTLTDSGCQSMPEAIYNAFTLFKDNFDAIMGVFSQLSAKTQVSKLAECFQAKYGRDLITFLKDGGGVLPWDGLSDSQFYTLTEYVKNLPATGY